MSTTETDLDLELHFLPAWARKAPEQNRYEHFAGEAVRPERGRGPRRDRDRGPQRQDRPSRPPGGRRPEGRQRPGGRPGREQRGEFRRSPSVERPAPQPLPEITVAFIPDDKGVDSLARQIRMTGRAYPLFDIAQMILQKPERHTVTLSSKKDGEGKPLQLLYVCALDETVWLSEDEAVRYILDKHFATFYQPERTKIDGPKGTYTFVAQCGMSGTILGPPNYHDYQNQLRKLHAERFDRMPFEAFKARVKIVKDEEVVKKWIEEQSWKTEYVCLNMPEPLKLGSREEVEKHFREAHAPNIIRRVETHKMSGTASRQLRSAGLVRAVRQSWEDQRRFPLQIATVLSQQFAAQGLQFFKVNKTITHVSVARPHFLDLETVPVSDGVKKIVHFINEHPRCTRRDLLAALAPATPSVAAAPPANAEAATTAPVVAPSEPSPEVTAIVGDLHWLIHQGHVIEFANGTLETAKKPAPKPPRAKAAVAEGETATVENAAAAPASPAEAPPTEGETQSQAEEVSAATEAAAQPGEPESPSEEAQPSRTEHGANV